MKYDRLLRLVAVLTFILVIRPDYAFAAYIIGSQERATSAQVSQAIMNSSLNSNLKQYANDIGQLAMFESGGRVGVYNGSCCTGLLQMNKTNLRAYGHTPESYANLGVNEQVEVWAKLTNSAAGAKSVQQLMSMESFDGKKVDGAMVLSCIQLGIGNCQTMLNSGSCRGFADSNGTSICDMADKIRGGKASPGSQTSPTDNNSQSTGSLTSVATQVENASKCWACTVVVKVGEVAVQIIPAVIDTTAKYLLPLFAIIFGIVTMFMIGRGFLWHGLMQWSVIFWNTMRFVAVYALISLSSFASDYVMSYAFYPSLQIGTALGEMGGRQGDVAFGREGDMPKCNFVQVDTSLTYQANSTIHDMSQLACKVHQAAYGPVVAGSALLSAKWGEATMAEMFTGGVISLIGLMMMIASILALAAFAMSIVEALLKLAITLSLSPIILFFWIFQQTRFMVRNAFNLLLYGMLLLALSGLFATVSSFVLSHLVSKGMGSTKTNVQFQEIFDWVNKSATSMDLSALVLFASFSIAGAMMASHLLRAASQTAASLTGAQVGQMSQGVVSGVRTFMMVSMGGPAVAVGMGTAYSGTRAITGGVGGIIGAAKSVGGGAGRLN